MAKETITRTKLTAGEGMMFTDGETFGTKVYLAPGDSPDNWREISTEEAQALMDKLTQPPEEVIP